LEIRTIHTTREALKSPGGDQAEHHVPPRRSRDGTIPLARPATTGMSATPPLALAPSANRAFETELSQTLYFRRLVSTGRAGVAEWQTQRT